MNVINGIWLSCLPTNFTITASRVFIPFLPMKRMENSSTPVPRQGAGFAYGVLDAEPLPCLRIIKDRIHTFLQFVIV